MCAGINYVSARRDEVIVVAAVDISCHVSHGTLVKYVIQRCREAQGFPLCYLVVLREAEIRLGKPRGTLGVWTASRDQTGSGILCDIHPLAAANDVDREGTAGKQIAERTPVTNIQITGFRRAAVGSLEDSEVGRQALQPA